jgi:hypothetical protein
MGNWNEQQSLEQSYIRSQTSAWDQSIPFKQGPTAKGVPFMPQAPEPSACFQQIYDTLTAKLGGDRFSQSVKAVAAVERGIRQAKEHGDPRKIDQPTILESLATLQRLDPAIAAQTQDCLRAEASSLAPDCQTLLAELLDKSAVSLAVTE